MKVERGAATMSLCPFYDLIKIPARVNGIHLNRGSVVFVIPLPDNQAARHVRYARRE